MRKNIFDYIESGLIAAIMAAIFWLLLFSHVNAAQRPQGTDTAKYQGNIVRKAYPTDQFNIAQIGGFYGGTRVDQTTYNSQMASATAAGLRAHTYMWDGVGGDMQNAKIMMDTYLPKIKGPKGSIVAIDFEDGASGNKQQDTDVRKYEMRRIAKAGFTPLLYTGKLYGQQHLYLDQIIKEFGTCLWIAAYRDYLPAPKPDYNWFPSMDGVAMWQYTSQYDTRAGGLDGNVDLIGITMKGYDGKPVEKPNQNPEQPSQVKLPAGVKREHGVFKPWSTLRIWTNPGYGDTGYRYYAGESIIYQGYIRNGNYIYAAYQTNNGAWRYVAVRENGVALGSFQ